MVAIKAGALWASALLASSLFSGVLAAPAPVTLDELQEEIQDMEKRASGTFAITGIPGTVRTRLEIRTMYVDKPQQWDLYVQALAALQRIQQSNQLSWFGIGGIHGSPNIPWDGVEQSAPGVGYCTHSINLFPTWHRPYIALFEMRVVAAARLIAKKYTGAQAKSYATAATNLRVPYWDWAIDPAAGLPPMPAILTAQKLSINTPSGKQTVSNPLYSYHYNPLNSADFSPYDTPFSAWPNTLRWPQSTASDASSHDGQAAAAIANGRASQKAGLYNWFTLCKHYLEASNDEASGSDASCHISLESLHNNIHTQVGGNNDGHMTVIPVSANDPTFMLHHAQIDRLFAMWQAIYPTSWCPNQVSQVDTFTINKGSVQGPNSPLTPFHKDTHGTFWTSNEVRKWQVFGYTYPEFHTSDGSSAAIRAAVNKLYGPNSSAHAAGASKRKRDEIEEEKRDILPDILSVPQHLVKANNGSSFQYIANIATTRFGLGGSYTVYLFMGDPTTDDAANWALDPKLIGSYGVFSSPDMTDMNLVTTSSVALTDALTQQVGNGALASLEELVVVPFLTQNLQWRVAKASNLEVVNPSDVPDFVLSVVTSTTAPLQSESDFPVWSPFTILTNITHGKPGGLPLGGTLSYLGNAASSVL